MSSRDASLPPETRRWNASSMYTTITTPVCMASPTTDRRPTQTDADIG
jgi:hypothetical protein